MMIRGAVATLDRSVGAVQLYRADRAALVTLSAQARIAAGLTRDVVAFCPFVGAPGDSIGRAGIKHQTSGKKQCRSHHFRH